MALSDVKALTFDVFGTVVNWRDSIAREAKALFEPRGYDKDWHVFADKWRERYQPAMAKVRNGERPWAKLDAYAGLRPGLIELQHQRPGSRILDGQFAAVQQAVGTPKKNAASFAFLKAFVEEAKQTGIVASFIEREGVVGRLSVAPPG